MRRSYGWRCYPRVTPPAIAAYTLVRPPCRQAPDSLEPRRFFDEDAMGLGFARADDSDPER